MVSKKGGSIHLASGRTFFFSMLGVVVSALIISILKNNLFLLLVSVFSLYLTYAGWRSSRNKSQHPNWLDWTLLIIAAFAGGFMIYTLNIILTVFGAMLLYLTIQDARMFVKVLTKQEIDPKTWLLRHLGMMMGSYISTLTAFLVVNVNSFSPAWLIWLAPTFIGVPIIVIFSYGVKKGL